MIGQCLTQAASHRPTAERLLSLPVIRAKATALGIQLPELAPAVGQQHAAGAMARRPGVRAFSAAVVRPTVAAGKPVKTAAGLLPSKRAGGMLRV